MSYLVKGRRKMWGYKFEVLWNFAQFKPWFFHRILLPQETILLLESAYIAAVPSDLLPVGNPRAFQNEETILSQGLSVDWWQKLPAPVEGRGKSSKVGSVLNQGWRLRYTGVFTGHSVSIWSPDLGCHLQLCRHEEASYIKNCKWVFVEHRASQGPPSWRLGLRGSGMSLLPCLTDTLGDPYHQRILRYSAEGRKMWPGRINWTFLWLFLATSSGFPESLLLVL